MAKGVKRSRLDAELVRRGLARSREHASELVAAGKVKVSGTVATKPATTGFRRHQRASRSASDGGRALIGSSSMNRCKSAASSLALW